MDSKGEWFSKRKVYFFKCFLVEYIVEIDECMSLSGNPCLNGGNCINTEGSYMCQCLPGWTGTNCDVGTYILNNKCLFLWIW